MDEQLDTTMPSEAKKSANWWGFVLWPFVIVILYTLSFGPFWMMLERRRITPENQLTLKFYGPLLWAYNETPLHKPLGIYLHLWASSLFNKNGDWTPDD
jgi:hypothetical protein